MTNAQIIVAFVISRSSVRIRLPAHSICDLRSAFAEATADKLPIPDRLRLIANCPGEALEINPLEIFGT